MRFKRIVAWAVILALFTTGCSGNSLIGGDQSKNAFIKLAEQYRDKYYSMLQSEEQTFVDNELSKLKNKGSSRLENALEISSIGGSAGTFGYSDNVAVTMTAAAAAIEPDTAIIANNFGAILRMLDFTDDSITVLQHAKTLQPDSTLILCNLANSFLEKGDDNSAEKLYTEVLQKDDGFGPAHQGLVLVYLKRKDIPKAIEELIKGATICIEGSSRDIYAAAKDSAGDDYEPPLAPLVPADPDLTPLVPPGSNSGSVDTPEAQLKIPNFPLWPNVDSYLASLDKTKKWADDLCWAERSGLSTASDFSKYTKTGRVTNSGNFFKFTLLADYYSAKVKKIQKEYFKKANELLNKFSDERTKLQDEYYPQMVDKSAGMGIPLKYREKADELARKLKDVSETHFSQWQSLAKDNYNELRQLMEEYWLKAGGFMKHVHDKDVFEQLNYIRKMKVTEAFYGLMTDILSHQLIFGVADKFIPLGGTTKERPKEEPVTVDQASVPDDNFSPCPLKKGEKLKFGFGPANISMDCESVEFEYIEGVAASVKYNHSKHTVTAFVGVGAKINGALSEKGAGSNVGTQLSGATGVYITVDKDMTVSDVGLQTKGSISLELPGGVSVSKDVKYTFGVYTGVNADLGGKLSFK